MAKARFRGLRPVDPNAPWTIHIGLKPLDPDDATFVSPKRPIKPSPPKPSTPSSIRRVRTRGTVSDQLVTVYRLLDQGRADDARKLLLGAWSAGMDALASEQDARVALKLLHRLGFSTDAADEWAALPDPLTVYRAGGPGLAWTADREVAEELAHRYELAPISSRTIAKSDALAYIAGRGESEVILDRE
jgi:hypothetical protein